MSKPPKDPEKRRLWYQKAWACKSPEYKERKQARKKARYREQHPIPRLRLPPKPPWQRPLPLSKDHGPIKAWLKRYKETHPCKDCDRFYPYYVMDFDHVRGKKLHIISSMWGSRSLRAIQLEIAKCDLVCSNCHRIRTFTQKQWYRWTEIGDSSGAHLDGAPLQLPLEH